MLRYLAALGGQWRALVTGLTGTVGLWVADSLMQNRYIPAWVWVVALATTVFVAQVLVYRDAERERNRALADLENIRRARSLAVGDLVSMRFIGEPVDQSTIQVGVMLQNFGATVLRYQVESMSVVVAGQTREHQPPAASTEGVIPPNATGEYWYPSIGPVDVSNPLDGMLDIAVVYGHPDLTPARRLVEKRAFSIMKPHGAAFVKTSRWTVLGSSDDPI
jgi:hypothetical protein